MTLKLTSDMGKTMPVNLKGLKRWLEVDKRRRIGGLFTYNGRRMTHSQAVKTIDWGIAHGCKYDQDIPDYIIEELMRG